MLCNISTMGKRGLGDFSIHLSSQQPVYYPGQTISGYVRLDVDKPTEIRSLNITFIGKTSVRWEESRGVGKNQRKKFDVTGKNIIVKDTTTLFHAEDDVGSSTHDLAEGRHEYQFSFDIPNKRVPSSFEGECGYIRYVLKSKVRLSFLLFILGLGLGLALQFPYFPPFRGLKVSYGFLNFGIFWEFFCQSLRSHICVGETEDKLL